MLMADLHHLERRAALRRVGELLDRFDLIDAAARTAGTYSGGMRRRLDLAMTLIGEPRLLFLDEPTAGLDPRSRRTMWQITRELVGWGSTVSSPPRTSTKPTSWPIGSRCSTEAAWSLRALRTS